jgi:hypothetical protein
MPVEPLIIKLGMSLTPADFDGLTRLMALDTSKTDTGAEMKV